MSEKSSQATKDRILKSRKSNIMDYVYHSGSVVRFEDATVSIAAISMQYGISAFAGIRGYYNDGKIDVLRLDRHHNRLMQGCKILGIKYSIPFEEFRAIIAELISTNKPDSDVYFRPCIYSGETWIAPTYKPAVEFDLSLYMMPLGSYFGKDLRLMTSSFEKYTDSSISSKAKAGGAYVNAFVASHQAILAGYDEALIMDKNSNVVEANVANIGIVKDGKLYTPPIGSDSLEGITFDTAKTLLKGIGIECIETNISKSMVYTADEMFVTGTAAQITPVIEVDGRILGKFDSVDDFVAGDITQALSDEFDKLTRRQHPLSEQMLSRFEI